MLSDVRMPGADGLQLLKAAKAKYPKLICILLTAFGTIEQKKPAEFAGAAKRILSAHAGLAWKSGGHTALPTMTTAEGPGSEILEGMTDNTEIGARLKGLYTR